MVTRVSLSDWLAFRARIWGFENPRLLRARPTDGAASASKIVRDFGVLCAGFGWMVDCVGMVLQGSRVAMRVGSQRCAGRGLKTHSIGRPSCGRGGIACKQMEGCAAEYRSGARCSCPMGHSGQSFRLACLSGKNPGGNPRILRDRPTDGAASWRAK